MSIGRHTAYNLLGSVAPLAISLATIPAYLSHVGEARYGVLAVAWLLLGYFGLFDLGLSRATAQRLAFLHGSTPEKRSRSLWTAILINLCMGCVGALAIWPAASFFIAHFLKADASLRAEVLAALPWLAFAVPVGTVSAVLTGALQGQGKFLQLNLISLVGGALFQLLPLAVAAHISVDLAVLLPVSLAARLVSAAALYVVCHRHILRGTRPVIARDEAQQLLRFGGWVTVTTVISPVMISLDRFLIGSLLGAPAVTHYSVPFQLADRTGVVPAALSSALFPRLVHSSPEDHARLIEDSLRAIGAVMTPLMGLAILLIVPFLSLWISPTFAAHAGSVARILLVGYWLNAFVMIPYMQLQAGGRPDVIAKIRALEVVPYIAVLFVCTKLFGLNGAALALVLRILTDFILFGSKSRMLGLAAGLAYPPAMVLALALLLSELAPSPQSLEWALAVVAYAVGTFAWAWQYAPAQLRASISRSSAKVRGWVHGAGKASS